jgi:TetR/AcrR family transcriptional regulator, regulator of cefoperazone and chloramphenicol sensitivity
MQATTATRKNAALSSALGMPTDARAHLCQVAMRIFADKGYANASTREICAAAGVNIAAINYYFGGKAGLYRAVFLQPVQSVVNETVQAVQGKATLEDALALMYRNFIGMVTAAQQGEHMMRLHAREMLDPSGVIEADALMQVIVPHHQALVTLLCRQLHLAKPDADVSRLVFAVIGLAHIYASDTQILNALAPEVLSNQEAATTLVQRLTGYACALVQHEAQRRAALKAKKPKAHAIASKKRSTE